MSIPIDQPRKRAAGFGPLGPAALHGTVALAATAMLVGGIVFFRQPGALIRLFDIPSVVLLFSVVALSVAIVCAGQLYVHHWFRSQDFVQHNEVGGLIFTVAGAIYAVILGFITVVAWQHYSDAQQLVAQESAAAVDAWHVAVGLPPAQRSRVRGDILKYANLMVTDEWPAMHVGKHSVESDMIGMDAIDVAETFNPANAAQTNAQTMTLEQLRVVHDTRQRRLSANTFGIAKLEWIILVLGAVCVLCFCWLFGLSNPRVHLLMTSAVTVIVASTMVLLFELQYPFCSGIGVPSDAWTVVVNHIHSMEHGMKMPQPAMDMPM